MSNVTTIFSGLSWEILGIGVGVAAVMVAAVAALQSWMSPANGVVARIDRVVTRAVPTLPRAGGEKHGAAALWSRLARPLVALAKP